MSEFLTRRQLLLSAAVGAAGHGLGTADNAFAEPIAEADKSATDIPGIDVHGHYGDYIRPQANALAKQFMSLSAAGVAERAWQAKIHWTIASPLQALLPRRSADPVGGNEHAFRTVPKTDGMRQWVVVDPLKPETYEQAKRMLKSPLCVGIKMHPEEHDYPITKYGNELFKFAADHAKVLLFHSGCQNSEPEDYVQLANDHRDISVILAHLGNGHDDDPSHQVRAIQASKHGNLFVDTSSARSLLPGLIEWAVKEIGSGQIVFGTDTPLYYAPMQRARIEHATISFTDKKRILWDNSARIFGLKERKSGA